jgi:hypothetical protein
MITDVFKMPKGKLHKPLALGEAKCYSTGSSVALQSLPDPALTELTHTVIHTYIHTCTFPKSNNSVTQQPDTQQVSIRQHTTQTQDDYTTTHNKQY